MKKQVVAILIALVVISSLLTVSVLSEDAFDKDSWNYEQAVIADLNSELKSMGDISFVTDTADKGSLTALTNQQDTDFIEWAEDTNKTIVSYVESLTSDFSLDNAEFWGGEIYRYATERLVEIDQLDVSPAMQPAKNEFKKYLQDVKQGAYYLERGAKNLDNDDLESSKEHINSADEHLENYKKLLPEDKEEIPTFPLVDNVSLCDAIYISIGNATVTDFLNATNITTVQVSNFKGYKGENTWRVQWSFSNRLLDVYINVTTEKIVGIEEKTAPTPTPTPTPAPKTWHSVITFTGSEDKTTPPFTIKGDEWRVKWSLNGSSSYTWLTGFYVHVYPQGQTSGYVSNWVCYESRYSDTQYISEGAGEYYFVIGAANLNGWKLEVEDYY